jgi:hypothetical protein
MTSKGSAKRWEFCLMPIFIDDSGSANVMKCVPWNVFNRTQCELIIIDYLQLMRPFFAETIVSMKFLKFQRTQTTGTSSTSRSSPFPFCPELSSSQPTDSNFPTCVNQDQSSRTPTSCSSTANRESLTLRKKYRGSAHRQAPRGRLAEFLSTSRKHRPLSISRKSTHGLYA